MRIRKFTRRKKIWALFLFIVFVSITTAGGLGLYYVNNFSDYLFSKQELIQSGDFEGTVTLERKILEDTEHIFEYVALARMFGEQDADNKTQTLYMARINGTEYNICIRDLERIYDILMGNAIISYDENNEIVYEISEEGASVSASEEDSADTAAASSDEMSSSSPAESTEAEGQPEDQSECLEQFEIYYNNLTIMEDSGVYMPWSQLDAQTKESIIKEAGWDYEKEGSWPARMSLESTAEILIYPGQTIELIYDYVQQNEVDETTDFISLYERGSGLLYNYYELKNELDAEETNLRFVVYENSSGIYETNDSSASASLSPEEAEAQICELEKYVSYDNNTHRLRSNFTKTEVKYWNLDYFAQTLVGVDSGASFAVGLDTRYLVQDDYQTMSQDFSRCRPILLLSLPAIVAGMIGSILAFIYLLASVGHREDYDEIWLDKFDRWPTEAAALLIVGGIFVFIGFCSVMASVLERAFFTSNLIYTVMQAISIIVSGIIGLIGFFSLVKRLKAGVVWKNSLLRKLCRKLGKWGKAIVGGWPTSGKVAALIFLYWLVTIPLCMFITINRFWGSSFLYVLGIIVFVGVQLAAAAVILWSAIKKKKILEGVERISSGDLEYVIDDEGMFQEDRKLVDGINHIGAGLQDAVNTAVQSERMKADLITNVSHDIKTPLTSIINYVDLMKRENIQDETLKKYLDVLDQKSQRLKTLTEDLVEASRASSGNISLQMERINFVELVRQACGEFSERFEERNLQPVITLPDYPLHVIADGRRVWRILENLFQNTKKYAMPGTRVYVSVEESDGEVSFIMKNISESPLNISAQELTERFTRGDVSRTTEGSGLGLSIAKDLTQIQGGIFEIYLNGDLFQVTVQFELAEEEPEEPETAASDGAGEAENSAEAAASDRADEKSGEDEAPGGGFQEEESTDPEQLVREALEELESSGLLKKPKPSADESGTYQS